MFLSKKERYDSRFLQ